jgi:hypothetical protein
LLLNIQDTAKAASDAVNNTAQKAGMNYNGNDIFD